MRVISEVGFDQYPVGAELPDGRSAVAVDRMAKVRKFGDSLQAHWRRVYRAVTILTVDETMIAWSKESQAHKTCIPNKPHPEGFCLKSASDANTKVMLSLEWVEESSEQNLKRWCTEHGAVAACTARVTEPWHNYSLKVVLDDSWFGGLPTSLLLHKFNIESVCNLKGVREGFPKKRLHEEAKKEGSRELNRGDTAVRRIELEVVSGIMKAMYGVLHTDSQPMLILCTTGRNDLVYIMTRTRS
jgi:hypothetical protein